MGRFFVAFLSAVFVLSPLIATAEEQITYQEPDSHKKGITLFWRFIDGYVRFYNLNELTPAEITLPDDAEIIIAYTKKNDPEVAQSNHRNLPVIYAGRRFWFAPRFWYAYRFLASHAFPEYILYKRLSLFDSITYYRAGITKAPKRIVIFYRAPSCTQLPAWQRRWRPCSKDPITVYQFKLFAPLSPEKTTKDITITYRARITNETTNKPLQASDRVAVGDTIRIHAPNWENTDIRWKAAKYWRYVLSYLRIRHDRHHWSFWVWKQKDFWKQYQQKENYGLWLDPGTTPTVGCRSEDLVATQRILRFNRYLLGNILHYVTMAVFKPAVSVSGIDAPGMNCQKDGADWLCTITQAGDYTITINYATTTLQAFHSYQRPRFSLSRFRWEGWDRCRGIGTILYEPEKRDPVKRCDESHLSDDEDDDDRPAVCKKEGNKGLYRYHIRFAEKEKDVPEYLHNYRPFIRTIAAQSINFTIQAKEANKAPSFASLSLPTSGKVNTPITLSFTPQDPEQDALYAEIQWTAQSQPVRYPETGTITPNKSYQLTHQWSQPGDYTVLIRLVDAKGAASGWESRTITIYDTPTLSFTADSYLIPKGASAMLRWSSQHATACRASGAWSGLKTVSGSERTATLNAFETVYTLTCENPIASTTKTLAIYTYACGDGICTTNVEDCRSCAADCGSCNSTQNAQWDIFINLTEDPPQIRYGGDADEFGN